MAIRCVDFKWYDGFFLSMLAKSVTIVAINWKHYHLCTYPLHIWIVVDYTAVFVFRMVLFVDNGLAVGMRLVMGLDQTGSILEGHHFNRRFHHKRSFLITRSDREVEGWQQQYARFYGRIVVLSALSLLLYPFLWAWTVIGTLWFSSARGCLPEEGQKWGFLVWLLFSYCGLVGVSCISMGKWRVRRNALLQRFQQGIPISEYGVLVDMVRVPDWAFEAAGQEMRGIGQDTAYHPGLYLTATQREAVEALIQELSKFSLKSVPTDCSECPICLEEFRVGNEVRGLPCAHNFHVECIDKWLRLNVKCPRCRCSVFPNLDLSALSNLREDSGRASASVVATSRYMRQAQPSGHGYLLRMQGLLRTIGSENGVVAVEADLGLEAADNGRTRIVITEGPASAAASGTMACVVIDQSSQLDQRAYHQR